MSIRKKILVAALALGTIAVPIVSEARTVVVQVGPPAPRVEAVPAPRRGYIWAPGYWDWRGRRHVWVGGHWERERRGYRWEGHNWRERDGRWEFERGGWRR